MKRMNEDEWEDLECLYKACETALRLIHRHGIINEQGQESMQRTDRSKQTKVEEKRFEYLEWNWRKADKNKFSIRLIEWEKIERHQLRDKIN